MLRKALIAAICLSGLVTPAKTGRTCGAITEVARVDNCGDLELRPARGLGRPMGQAGRTADVG
jgi:hypothetical protein